MSDVRVSVVAVGKMGRLFGDAAAEYEKRAGRYWKLEVREVREARGADAEAVQSAEADRIVAALPVGLRVASLTREGVAWSSAELAAYLQGLALHAHAGVAFVVGGALGLHESLLGRSDLRFSLSRLTFPHELARVALLEQLYRAGTIMRGEPYHKGGAA